MSAITVEKLVRVLSKVQFANVSSRSLVWSNGNGELCIQLTGQPSEWFHKYLLKRGFILYEGDYIYRPYRGKK